VVGGGRRGGIVLGAAYMLWLFQRTMFGKVDNPKNEALPDLSAARVRDLRAADRAGLLDRALPGAVPADGSRPRSRTSSRG
jgi:hypothetical protein